MLDTAGYAGPVPVTVRAVDTTGTSRSVTNTVVVSITKAPAHKAKVSGTVSVTAAAADTYGVNRVELLINGKVAATGRAAGYAFAVNTAKFPSTMTVQVRAYDKAGNVRYTAKRTWYR